LYYKNDLEGNNERGVVLKVIGLAGGIGTGKSTVARFLAELGATVLDLDKTGHDALKKGTAAFLKVVDIFGKDILATDGEIDRAKLGEIVFNDRRALERFNAIVHPAIDAIVLEKISRFRREGVKVLVLEAAVIVDAGKQMLVEELWVTVASRETVIKRLKERSGYSRAESEKRINSQMSDKERVKQADVVINTDCSLDELKIRVKVEWEKLLKRL
jgi:dephospho-CoA kinase